MTATSKIARGFELIRRQGPAVCAFRAKYEFLKRTGLLKQRFPPYRWDERPLDAWCRPDVPMAPHAYREYRRRLKVRFFFHSDDLPKPADSWRPGMRADADAVTDGKIRYFSDRQGPIGDQESWFTDPFTGRRVDHERHWCDRDHFEDRENDIKVIWEPARFTWTFALARGHAATQGAGYARAFWRLLKSWRDANPPQIGPHWQCGQECSFRLFALVFGLYVFEQAAATTDDDVALLAATVAALAERIEGNIGFALSQRNNHALSEAAGLYTAGTLFPEFKQARRWRERGKKLLEREGRRQIRADGSYAQHSMNYHRVMLQDFLWVLRLAELNDDAFSGALRDRLARAAEFSYQMQDESSGRLPNYGPNDGALVLPLTNCNYLDHRPTLQAMSVLLHRKRLFDFGPWDELSMWFCGDAFADAPHESTRRSSVTFSDGGYDTLRGSESWAMVRCHTYRDRPNEADMLHLDLWWRGQNVLRDAGTYSYHCPAPWNHYFRSTAAHNTIVLDDLDQMTKGPRFLWFNWVESRRLEHHAQPADRPERWCGEHYGYRDRCGVVHRRTIERWDDERWTITDELVGKGTHRVALHWHLLDAEWVWNESELSLRLDAAAGPVWLDCKTYGDYDLDAGVVRGLEEDGRVLGWESLYYGTKQPHPVLRLGLTGDCPMKIVTQIGLGRRPRGVQGDTESA